MAPILDNTPILEGDVALTRHMERQKLGLGHASQRGDGGDVVSLVTEERMRKKLERYEACRPVALEILEEARRALAVRFRFLDAALWRMPLEPRFDLYGIASDGRAFYFDPVYVVDRFKLSFNEVVRDVIHCLFHCIFRHPFMLYSVLRQPWDVACDIAIEAMILDLVGEAYPVNMDRRAKEALKVLSAHVGGIVTAERLYWFFGNEGNKTDLKSLAPMFYHDSHSLWYGDEDERMDPDGSGAGRPEDDEGSAEGPGQQSLESEALDDIVSAEPDASDAEDGAEAPAGGASDEATRQEQEELSQEWEGISQRMQVDLEAHLAKRGEGAGNLVCQLRALNREVGDYAEFLRRFAALHETLRVNDDEFDYIYYTFGLDRYGNMPLIEPLEYKEDRRVHDFAIAIDTSESCSGEVVQAFMEKTYNILRSSESFHDRVNIHLIQCDAAVQEDTKITSLSQFERHLEKMELKGFGGTDFRPVFEYVDALIAKGEFTDLRGLIYFTDGEGVFPKKPPAYDAAFIFLDDGFTDPEVPPWAMKMLLDARGLNDGRPADKG